jgi:pyridoxamine 5'-phosphate oxidase
VTTLREALRSTPSVTGTAPDWSPDRSPDDPGQLFVEWLTHAIAVGEPEPQAATLSTVDVDGSPDARVLVIKDVAEDFDIDIATGLESAKGRQLSVDPRCALTFYWKSLARSVRIRGTAIAGSAEESARDYLARHPDARAIAATQLQSTPMDDPDLHERRLQEERDRISADAAFVSPTWVLWHIRPQSAEFWQGAPSRDHLRLRYSRANGRWRRERLWA